MPSPSGFTDLFISSNCLYDCYAKVTDSDCHHNTVMWAVGHIFIETIVPLV